MRRRRRMAKLPAAGLGLLVAVGVLGIVLALRSGGHAPSAAGSTGASSPGAMAEGVASAAAVASATARPAATGTARSTAGASGRAAGSAGSRTARPADPLNGAAAAYLGSRSGTVLAAVYDVSTGQTWTTGGAGQVQDEASVVKLDVLETLLAQQPDGLPPADQALAQAMIENSDNDAATTLWNTAGGADGIRAFNVRAGLASTTPSACVQCPGFTLPGWGLSTTTPLDQIALLRELVAPPRGGSVLNQASRDYALGLMNNVTDGQRWGVTGGVPAQATVALKDGWLPLNEAGTDWQINSVGWVNGQGRDYLIAVLSTQNPSEDYGIATISQLSALVWQGLR